MAVGYLLAAQTHRDAFYREVQVDRARGSMARCSAMESASSEEIFTRPLSFDSTAADAASSRVSTTICFPSGVTDTQSSSFDGLKICCSTRGRWSIAAAGSEEAGSVPLDHATPGRMQTKTARRENSTRRRDQLEQCDQIATGSMSDVRKSEKVHSHRPKSSRGLQAVGLPGDGARQFSPFRASSSPAARPIGGGDSLQPPSRQIPHSQSS